MGLALCEVTGKPTKRYSWLCEEDKSQVQITNEVQAGFKMREGKRTDHEGFVML